MVMVEYSTPKDQPALLTGETVAKAVSLFQDTFEKMVRSEKRQVVYIVVLDPTADSPEIVWKGAIGEQDPSKWEKDYEVNAIRKASVVHRAKLSGHVLKYLHPHMFKRGDFKYYGAVYHHGIVVAASGLKEYQDHIVSGTLAVTLEALCMWNMHGIASGTPFMTGE